jgi:hypothetical protein
MSCVCFICEYIYIYLRLNIFSCCCRYCECFASGGYCGPDCKCVGCANTPKSEGLRTDAIHSTLERNPNAFKPKISINTTIMHITDNNMHPRMANPKSLLSSVSSSSTSSSYGQSRLTSNTQSVIRHFNGCHCKKSQCQKKYCECFQAGVPCGENCKCTVRYYSR